jgi:hypothetical protein
VCSVRQPSAEVADEAWVPASGWLIEPFVLVVGLVGSEKPGVAPGLDRAGVHAELFGDLVECQQAAGAESVGVAWEVAASPEPEHDPGGERLVHAGPAASGVELLGDLGVGVVVEELADQREGVGVGLAFLPGVERDRDRQAGRLPAAEADVEMDAVGPVQSDVFDQQPGDPLALARRGGGI